MGLQIVIAEGKGLGASWVADRDIYVTRDGKRLLGEKELEGRLLAAKGQRLPELEAVRLGLISAKDAGAQARAAFDADQERAQKERDLAERRARGEQVDDEPEAKEAEQAEDKGAGPAKDKGKKKGGKR